MAAQGDAHTSDEQLRVGIGFAWNSLQRGPRVVSEILGHIAHRRVGHGGDGLLRVLRLGDVHGSPLGTQGGMEGVVAGLDDPGGTGCPLVLDRADRAARHPTANQTQGEPGGEASGNEGVRHGTGLTVMLSRVPPSTGPALTVEKRRPSVTESTTEYRGLHRAGAGQQEALVQPVSWA